jgi:hypothetical protein
MNVLAGPELMLMMLLWLPSSPVGQPATPTTVFRYVPAQANMTVGVDVGSLTTSAMRGFIDLGQQPFIKRSRDLSRRYAQVNRAVQRGLQVMKMMGNLDPIRDVRYLTASARVEPGKRPLWVVAVGGNLKAQLVERMALGARAAGPTQLANGRLYASTRRGRPSFGWTKDDVLLVGSEPLLKQLLRRKPRPSKLARLAMSQYDGQTMFTAALRPGRGQARKRLTRSMPPFLRNLGGSLDGMAFSLRYDGLRLALAGTNGRVLARFRKLLDGGGDYLAAAELIARGSLKVGDGLLSPQDARLLPRRLRALATNKTQLLRYLRRYVPLNKNPSHTTSIDARRRLAKLNYKGSRYAGLIPVLGMVGMLTARSSATMRAMPPRATPAVPRSRP